MNIFVGELFVQFKIMNAVCPEKLEQSIQNQLTILRNCRGINIHSRFIDFSKSYIFSHQFRKCIAGKQTVTVSRTENVFRNIIQSSFCQTKPCICNKNKSVKNRPYKLAVGLRKIFVQSVRIIFQLFFSKIIFCISDCK